MEPTANNVPNLLQVSLLEPEKTLYSGEAEALTCRNTEGEFDILPFHSNFVSLVDGYVIIHTTDKKQQKIDIGKALLKASENRITILLNIDLTERDLLFKALFQQVEGQKQADQAANAAQNQQVKK